MTSVDSTSRYAGGRPLLRWRFPAAILVLAAAVIPFDSAIVDALNPDHAHALDGLARWLDAWSTRLLVGVALFITFAAFLFRRLERWREALAPWLVGWVMTDGVVRVAKTLTGRPRPCHPDGMGEAVRSLFDRPDLLSLPSGHTATAVAFAIWGWVHLPKAWLRVALTVFAVAIGLGRTYVGAHYFSDVLAGAAVGWACMALAHHLMPMAYPYIVRLDVGVRHQFATAATGILMMTWICKDAPRLMDPMIGQSVEGFHLRLAMSARVLEPIIGPGMRLSAQPDLMAFSQDCVLWATALVCLGALVLRRRVLGWIGAALLWSLAVSWVAFGGVSPDARLVADDGDWVIADLQNHSGDPTDGHISLNRGLDRAKASGLSLVQTTYHNRWSPVQVLDGSANWTSSPNGLFGMEWSAGDHRESPLHLLVYNTHPEPSDLADERDPRRMIERVHEAGGVVIASHFWRGRTYELPKAAELIAMEIDGFEVCGRSQEYRAEQLDRQAALRALAESESLVALASSDFHGRRGHVYQWMAIPRNDGESPSAAMWAALKLQDRPISLMTRETVAPHPALPRVLIPLHVAVRYLRELTPGARVVWMVWLWGGALLLRFRSTRSQRKSR